MVEERQYCNILKFDWENLDQEQLNKTRPKAHESQKAISDNEAANVVSALVSNWHLRLFIKPAGIAFLFAFSWMIFQVQAVYAWSTDGTKQ